MVNYKYFTEDELRCKCGCGQCLMDNDFMTRVEFARDNCDFPWIPRSAYRCPAHDTEVKGDGNHPTGKALDVEFHSSHELFVLVREVIQQGIRRIGIKFEQVKPTAKGFLHFDTVSFHPDEVLWGY